MTILYKEVNTASISNSCSKTKPNSGAFKIYMQGDAVGGAHSPLPSPTTITSFLFLI